MAWVTIVAILALIQYTVFGAQVGRARGTYNVEAPAVSGHPVFERYYRVQMNTLESLVTFLPSLFLFAHFLDATIAAGVGVVFIIGRQLFARAYANDPKSRGPGFLISMLANFVLMLGALVSAVLTLI